MQPLFAALVIALAPQQDPDPVAGLLERCASGELDHRFDAACRAVIELDVRGHALGAALPDDLFEWIGQEDRLRGDALLAMATVGPKVASNLVRLRAMDEGLVERYPSLAVAFAAAWSRGDDAEPQRFWVDEWLVRGREVPELEASFRYYTQQQRDMRLPLRDAPWQVLSHLADSVVPIEEREWAVARYRKRRTPGLRDLFGAVPYTLDPQRGDRPCTLESFLEIGGPCTHNVQFAGGVFDAFGIPSGWAGGPGHTYPYWFEANGKAVTIHRTNELGNRNGKIRDPLGEGHVWEDRMRLLVDALNDSLPGQRRAALAAWAHGRVPTADRAAAAAILPAAIRANPYTHEALAALADATRARELPLEDAGRAWLLAARALTDHPHELLPLLDAALPAPGISSPNFDGDDALLALLERQWERDGLVELALRAQVWRGRALSARGKRRAAERLLTKAAQALASIRTGPFGEAVATLTALHPGVAGAEERVKVLGKLIEDLPAAEPGEWSTLHRSRLIAVRALVNGYEDLGREDRAALALYEELDRTRVSRPDPESGTMLVGGGGGAPFESAPPGAILTGIRAATTGFNGREVIGCVEGLFDDSGELRTGTRAGDPRPGAIELRAPDGWYVAGMFAAGTDRLNGIQLLFARQGAGNDQLKLSEWIGSQEGQIHVLGGPKSRAIGLRGRAGADVDALGLVF